MNDLPHLLPIHSCSTLSLSLTWSSFGFGFRFLFVVHYGAASGLADPHCSLAATTRELHLILIYSFYLLIFKILLFAVSFICLLVIPSAVLYDLFDVLFITLLLFALSLPVYDLRSLNLPLFMVGSI